MTKATRAARKGPKKRCGLCGKTRNLILEETKHAATAILCAHLLLGLMFLCGCESDPEPVGIHPARLVAQIGGLLGASYAVVLNGSNSVIYSHNPHTFTSYPGTEHEVIEVSEERWIRFRQALDEAKVWRWRREYVNKRIYDGTSWLLDVQYSDKSIVTRGRNDYPRRDRFERFLQAVRELTGGKEFR